MNALTQLGMVSDFPSENQTKTIGSAAAEETGKDYFQERDGIRFAGMHLLADFWGASRLDDASHIDTTLRRAAVAAGATVLHSHFHRFSPNGGVSGVVILAESHISIHTWPERGFAALDIFMCGACDPHQAMPVLQQAFTPTEVKLDEQRRGQIG